MAVSAHSLEHFYYGHILYDGKPQGELRLLAGSSGIRQEHFAEAVSALRVPPAGSNPTMAFALARGKTTPYLLVQSQRGAAGNVICHYMMPTPKTLRALSGNLRALMSLIETPMPTFERTDATLPVLTLTHVEPPGMEAQQDAMIALLTATGDRFDVIEALLAALIQTTPIAIKGAPLDLDTRMGLIEGLLALLPPPARLSITFSAHVTPATVANAQIKYYTDDAPTPVDALLYQWGERKVEGVKSQNDYARYIRSQLRLDTGLVVQQTTALTPIAGYRLGRGDGLEDALKYASFRLTIDNAVANGQPIEVAEVARVLGEDPTLDDDNRIAYVRHLLAFIMATDDVEDADVLVVAQGKQVLETAILEQMNEMMTAGKSLRVYRALTRWLAHPAGFRGMYWIDLTQKAAMSYAQSLVRPRDSKAMNYFLAQVREHASLFEAKYIVPRLLEIALPLAASDPMLAQTAIVLAATSLPLDAWQRFVSIKPLLDKLPRSLGRLIAYFNAEVDAPAAPGLLAQAAFEFGTSWRSLILIRLAEIALSMGRTDIFDPAALTGLAQAAATSWGDQYDGVLRRVVYTFNQDATLQRLPDDSARALLQILLSRQAYADLANELARHGRVLFPSGKQIEFAAAIRNLFTNTPIVAGNVADCLAALAAEGVKPLPLSMAHFGVLAQHQWNPNFRQVGADLISLLTNNRLLVESLSTDLLLDLLKFHSDMHDMPNTIRVSALMPINTSRHDDDGIAPMIAMYRLLAWEPGTEGAAEVQKASLEYWRRFVRWSSDATARAAINQMTRVDEGILESLKATYFLRRMLSGENVADYSYALHTTANFLQDTGIAYADRARLPMHNMLIGDLDSLNGGISDDDRRALAEGLIEIIRFSSALADQHRAAHPRESDADIQQLLEGQGEALSVLDMLRVMSGYFGRGRRVIPKLEKLIDHHPLGDRTAPALLREVQTISRMLKNARLTFPVSGKITVRTIEIIGEIESLWSDVTLHERRELVADLAMDLQRIPDMVLNITNRVDAKTLLEANSLTRKLDTNKQRPENALEYYRFIAGYFRGRIRESDS